MSFASHGSLRVTQISPFPRNIYQGQHQARKYRMQLPDFSNTEVAFRSRSHAELWRALGLFKVINVPILVKAGGPVLTAGFKLKLPLSPLVRWTVFRQFCGGESLEECRETIARMAKDGVESILDYGLEGEKSESGFDAATEEILRTAEEARKTSHIPFVVFKMTAVARMELLEKLNSSHAHSSLSQNEQHEWSRVLARVDRICDAANKCGKPVMIDAEETWIQNTVDQVVEVQMKKRNTGNQALVYTTAQMYRVDRLDYLKALAAKAEREGWTLGVKLVRGAYMEKERARAERDGKPSPIQHDKEATDHAYDAAVAFFVENTYPIWVCVGSHNENSCMKAAELILAKSKQNPGLADRFWFSQLLGMSDHLTYNLANAGFNVAKYVPYGPVQAVLPYLIRRAQENTSVAGQSSRELTLITKELERRKKQS